MQRSNSSDGRRWLTGCVSLPNLLTWESTVVRAVVATLRKSSGIMRLYFTLSLLAFVFVSAAQGGGLELDRFWTKYGGVKIMKSCLSAEGTEGWIEELHQALSKCNTKLEGRSLFVRSVEEADWAAVLEGQSSTSNRKRRSVTFTAEKIRKLKEKLTKQIEIFRCVMQEVGMTDANNTLSTSNIIDAYRPANISATLRADIEQAIMQCHAFTECLPLEGRKDLPIPADVIKAKAFIECEKYLRYWACLKEDVKRKIAKGYFDFKGLNGRFSYLKNDEEKAVAILVAEELVGPDDYNLYE